ncbi:MAG: response regulator [Chloroflexi bacterium]|nr:response regulator [Chloroflexota bacterium]
MATTSRGKVLVIDGDSDIADLVQAVLTDEGFLVSILTDHSPNAIRKAVGQQEPDCVILDSAGPMGFGRSWDEAIWLRGRLRSVPVIMFSTHGIDTREARERISLRSRAAAFTEIVEKPFSLDALIAAVARAVRASIQFEETPSAEAARTQQLVERLHAAGAHDIRPSTLREWATFRTADDSLVQMYWWQAGGVYIVARYVPETGVMERIGQFHDLDAAVQAGASVRRSDRKQDAGDTKAA